MRDPVLLAVMRRIETKLIEFEESINRLGEKLDTLSSEGLSVTISVDQDGESEGEVNP